MRKLIILLIIGFTINLSAQNQVPLKWDDDLSKAIPASISSNKPLLLFFTGSDWCGWCMRLKREVFAFDEFKKWTDDNVILVELDFPRRKQLPANIAKQNRELQQIFQVRGYPTVWLVTPQIIKSEDPENPGNKINFLKLGSLGYVAGGPSKWIASANQFLIKK